MRGVEQRILGSSRSALHKHELLEMSSWGDFELYTHKLMSRAEVDLVGSLYSLSFLFHFLGCL